MKTKTIKDFNQALDMAVKEGEVTLQDENGEQYTLTHKQAPKPVNVALLRTLRVKIPNITSEELVESVHQMRAAGYN